MQIPQLMHQKKPNKQTQPTNQPTNRVAKNKKQKTKKKHTTEGKMYIENIK